METRLDSGGSRAPKALHNVASGISCDRKSADENVQTTAINVAHLVFHGLRF